MRKAESSGCTFKGRKRGALDTIIAAVAVLGHKTDECKESVLIREGFFFGRQFRFKGVRAVWCAEKDVVTLYGDDAQLLRTLTVADEPAEMRRAA